jgi:tripartite motif-containing protein 71
MKEQMVSTLLLCTALSLSYVFFQSWPNEDDVRMVNIGPLPTQPRSYRVYLPLVKVSKGYVFLESWGNEIGVFDYPTGIAVSGNRVYVCDTRGDRIQAFDLHGKPLSTLGGKGSSDGRFRWPTDIGVDGSGNVYVADSGNHRIQKFTSDGVFITKWGSCGSGDGQFDWPVDIAVDRSGKVYVSERWNHRVQKFTSDGVFITK